MSNQPPTGPRRLDGLGARPVKPKPSSADPVAPDPGQPLPPPTGKPVITRGHGGKPPRPKSKFRLWRRIALAVLIVAVVSGGYLGVKTVLAARHVIVHNAKGTAPALAKKVDPTTLKGEGNGRINILLLGVGGGTHDGPELSDTMMVMSIDPVNKTVALLSIPRDLYVKIPGYGYSKINAANSDGGPALAEQVVEQVLDVPIHYYVHVDFSGFEQAVDAVGGIDITNTQTLSDTEYPCDNNQAAICGYYLPPGQYHMTGAQALKFARCRKGTCGNDFGRAARQQQVLVAVRQKALTLSVLTNPIKIGQLIDAVGSDVRTDLQLSDIVKLASMVKAVDPSQIQQKVIDNGTSGLLVDQQSPTAGDILVPAAGEFDYTDIQNLAHSLFADPYIIKENATVQVQNGSGRSGIATAVVAALQASHYNVGTATNSAQYYPHTEIIDYSGGKKPYTVSYLEQSFGVTAVTKTPPPTPAGAPAGPQVVVILGGDFQSMRAEQ